MKLNLLNKVWLRVCMIVAVMTTAFAGNAWSFSTTYYSKATAHAIGEGKVYVKYNATVEEANRVYAVESSDNASEELNYFDTKVHTYYMYAKANEGAYFVGWYNNSDCTGNVVSTETLLEVEVDVRSTQEKYPTTEERWAKFMPKNAVVFNTPAENTIPYGASYTVTVGVEGTVDVQTDGDVTASSSNTAVATVSGLTITPVAVGTTTITLTAAEGATYLAGSSTVTLTVTAPEGMSEGAPSTPETYTIPASGVGTYCSQYPIDLTKLPEGVVAYAVKEKTASLVRLKEIEDAAIKGGVGFILKGEGGAEITFSYTDSENVPSPNKLVGTLAPTYLEERTAYGLKNGEFHPNTAGTINAHRAYVPAEESNPTKALMLVFEEEDPTGIENVNGNLNLNDEAIYNLAGQRINKMQRGINIVNGKKILY